jgi:hypothetical protein
VYWKVTVRTELSGCKSASVSIEASIFACGSYFSVFAAFIISNYLQKKLLKFVARILINLYVMISLMGYHISKQIS